MRRLPIFLAAVVGCSGPSDSYVPQLGRYQFDTSFAGASYGGILTITAASKTEISYSIAMVDGATDTDTSGYSDLNGYVIVAHANGWNMLPHLVRNGSSYNCYGNAVFPSTVMSCTWTYLGP